MITNRRLVNGVERSRRQGIAGVKVMVVGGEGYGGGGRLWGGGGKV